jgi:amino acid adenylation domain-containing protein
MAITAVDRVLQAAKDYPDRPALDLHNATYTYRELTEAAAAVACSINELEDKCPFVGVMADKSFSCYSGILGILMAGKAYLPVNPRFPASRNRYMLEKARVRTIIAGDNSDDELDLILENNASGMYVIFPEGSDSRVAANHIALNDPAYLLFTSGTTGKPKGVPVSHGNLAAYLDFMLKSYDFNAGDRFTQIFDLTFDLSVHDIFLAWSTGACLCVPEDNSSFAMSRFIHDKKPTVWFSVPTVVSLMDRMRLLKPGAYPSIRLSFFCGEAFQVRTALAWKNAAPDSKLINIYGPTETTIAISRYNFPDNPGAWKSKMGIASIGRIFNGNSYLIDKEHDLDPGGELCLSGHQVVDGYYENEEADKASFYLEPFSKQKYYRTGDLVTTDDEGDLFFLGRKDDEVKISGYRVNLKEIENVLEGYEMVSQAVVIHEKKAYSDEILLAFILLKNREEIPEEKDID